MKPKGVLETCLYVDDLPAAEDFYRGVLGLDFVSRQPGRHVFLRCGNGMLLLFDPRASDEGDATTPPHGARGAGHLAFAVDPDELEPWRKRFEELGVTIERIVDWPGGFQSLYFRDPAGNSLELAPPEMWQYESTAGSGE